MNVVAIMSYGSPFMRAVKANPHAFMAIPMPMFTGMLREYIQEGAYKNLSDVKVEEYLWPWTCRGDEGKKTFIRQIQRAEMKHTQEMQDLLGKLMGHEEDGQMMLKILRAEDDNWITIAKGEKLAVLTKASEFVRVAFAGHRIQVDQPERVMYEIAKWLEKVVS